jgi:hypothetical protein
MQGRCISLLVFPALTNEHSMSEMNVQNGVLKVLSFCLRRCLGGKVWIVVKYFNYYIPNAQAGNFWQMEISEHVFYKSCAYLVYRLSWYIRMCVLSVTSQSSNGLRLPTWSCAAPHARQEVAGGNPSVFVMRTALLGTDSGNKQIHDDLGIPSFAVHVRALTDICNRCG